MDLIGSGAAMVLIAARAVHFGASALLAGALLFRAVIAEPAASPAVKAVVDRQMRWIVVPALAVAIVSGAIWFVVTAAAMGNVDLAGVFNRDVLVTVLELTQFGSVAVVRLALAALVGLGLIFDEISLVRWFTLVAALALVGSVAWTGHAGSGFGASGDAQLAADVLHLLAASAWIGSLVPLALLLSHAARADSVLWSGTAEAVTRRFSTLGVTSVAILIASGATNSFFLVGSLNALTTTDYGRVLMAKLVLFVLMLAIAAVNRTVVTPQLAAPVRETGSSAVRKLARHCVYETALGLMIIAIVGWLGTLHPAVHFMP